MPNHYLFESYEKIYFVSFCDNLFCDLLANSALGIFK